jgi:hypothetical protein
VGIPRGSGRSPSNADIIPFKTAHQSDFRAPSNLNRWLSEGRLPQYPLLTAVLAWNELSFEIQEIFRQQVLPGGKLRIFKR